MPRHLSDDSNDLSQPWMKEAEQYFPPVSRAWLPWPVGSIMVSEPHRVLYSPVAKCACTSLKTMMVHLAQVEHAEQILKHGVHRVTDKFSTGMQLKDIPRQRSMEIRHSDEYYKFAAVRDPVERIVSAYTEKFVVNRRREGNHWHTRPVISAVQGNTSPDMDKGITFRQFVEYIISQPASSLDTHWIPQHLSLRGVDRYNRIFRIDQLDELKTCLENWTGAEIVLGELNKTAGERQDAHEHTKPMPENVVDLLPAQLDALKRLNSALFMEKHLVETLRQYYSEDIEIYNATYSDTHGYTPPEPLGSNIWKQINIYCKGYFGARANGESSVGIVIFNGNSMNIDAASHPGLAVQSTLFGHDRQALSKTRVTHPLITTIPGKNYLQVDLSVSVPQRLLSKVAGIEIGLVTTEHGRIADHSALHMAGAQFFVLPD